jgi:hypothetical protein
MQQNRPARILEARKTPNQSQLFHFCREEKEDDFGDNMN